VRVTVENDTADGVREPQNRRVEQSSVKLQVPVAAPHTAVSRRDLTNMKAARNGGPLL
jgi:hypothetical protein